MKSNIREAAKTIFAGLILLTVFMPVLIPVTWYLGFLAKFVWLALRHGFNLI